MSFLARIFHSTVTISRSGRIASHQLLQARCASVGIDFKEIEITGGRLAECLGHYGRRTEDHWQRPIHKRWTYEQCASILTNEGGQPSRPSGVLLSKIADAEKKITGNEGPARDGRAAQAQRHANERISSESLSYITAGERRVAGDMVETS